MAGGDAEKPISLFYSYSHRDEELRRQLEDHLAALRWSGMIAEWHDRNIDAGDEWAKEIDRNLSAANIILLLVSASFIASKYCWSVEMTKALERHDKGEARVIPVILRPCRWGATPFAKLQAAPTDAKPVTSWSDLHAALEDVAGKIERVVTELQQQRRSIAAERARQQKRDFEARQQEEQARHQADAAVCRSVERVQQEAPGTQRQTRGGDRVRDLAVFRDVDAPWCPEMVALPAGAFLMGSRVTKEDSVNCEGPQHRVKIGNRFALGRSPITVGSYAAFVDASGHCHDGGLYIWKRSTWQQDKARNWRDPGFTQTDRHPVVGVNWWDALAYCNWLSKETGKAYRLPSEAEWEYACRAGTTTYYSFGDSIAPNLANFSTSKLRKTTNVDAYLPNPWGLLDMHGNVWEWVQDIWNDSYTGAPTDGSAWTDAEDESSRLRVGRDGCWRNSPKHLRSTARNGIRPDLRNNFIGFRVARTLD